MSKTVVIHQPDFLPHLGFFHRFLNSDHFIVLDHVQYVKGTSRAWTNRDKIKTVEGERWLTVSTKKASHGTPINQIELSDTVDWRNKNLSLLEHSYNEAPYYSEVIPYVKKLYEDSCNLLCEFNMKSIIMLMELLDVKIPYEMSSNMNPQGRSNELLVDLLKKSEATHYLSGQGAKDYYQPGPFEDAGIKVKWQEFKPPVYPQLNGEFIPYLSSIDLLFNCGIDGSKIILRGSV